MNGRIFTCHHVMPERVFATSLFSTLISGAHGDDLTGLVGDLDGTNIAEPNRHSEMRHQYHVWQDHLEGLDYVGFEHYRRILFINPLTSSRMRRFNPWLLEVANQLLIDELCVGGVLDQTLFNAYQDLREICEGEMKSHMDFIMRDADIVTHRVQPIRLDEQFKQCHPPEHWDIFTQAVQETRFFARAGGLIDFRLRATFFCNMHVMRTEYFRQYMDFWWETMRKLEQRLPLTERYLGYFAERLVNLFVNGLRHQNPRLRVRALPFVAYQ